MSANRVMRYLQFGGDLSSSHAKCHQAHDFSFPRREWLARVAPENRTTEATAPSRAVQLYKQCLAVPRYNLRGGRILNRQVAAVRRHEAGMAGKAASPHRRLPLVGGHQSRPLSHELADWPADKLVTLISGQSQAGTVHVNVAARAIE